MKKKTINNLEEALRLTIEMINGLDNYKLATGASDDDMYPNSSGESSLGHLTIGLVRRGLEVERDIMQIELKRVKGLQ